MGRAVTAISGGDSSFSRCSSSPSSSAESSFREHDDVFLQTQTRIWLSEVLETRLDDRVDLSELLADGELLFDVSKLLWNMLLVKCKELRHVKEPKCNPIGFRKSIGRYRPYSNVDSFLKICKILGLNGVDLFSPSDVVEKRDKRKVCICIRSLSKKARSKQLKVPDFDIVTYTIQMPTVMVGSLRRSLESSKCSTEASGEYTPRRDSKLKSRQKIRVGFCDENDGIYSESSSDTKSDYMRQLTYSFSKSNSYDSAKSKGIDDSPEVFPALRKSNGDIPELENNDHELRHSGLSFPEEKSTSFWSEFGENCSVISSSSIDSHRSLCGRDNETDFPDDASFAGDSFDDMVGRLYISPQFAFPDITLGLDNENDIFDGEDNGYNLLMGLERKSTDDFDDVEVSSVSSMSSVFGRVLNLNFDEQSDVGDLRCEIHDIDSSENFERSFTSDTENPILDPENGNSGFCNKSPLSCSSSQSHVVENEERFGSLKNDSDIPELNSIEGICTMELTSKDENKCLDVKDLAELTDEKEEAEKKPSSIKSHKRPILRAVVKGTAVFGIVFFLLHLRYRNSNENRVESDKKSRDNHHVNGTRNTMKAQKRGRENGVYPADKFKFQN